MLSQVPQEDVVVFSLVVRAKEISDRRVVHIVQQNQQVVEDLNGIGLEDVDLGHVWVFRVDRVFQVLLHCLFARVYDAVLSQLVRALRCNVW